MSYDDEGSIAAAIRAQTEQQRWTILPAQGWMVTIYGGNDEHPFDPEHAWTTPVLGWRISLGEPSPEADPSVGGDPIWYFEDNYSWVSDYDTRLNRWVWHPNNVGVPATAEEAAKALEEEHKWWPVERMTITAAQRDDSRPDGGWIFTVTDDTGNRTAEGKVTREALHLSKASTLGLPEHVRSVIEPASRHGYDPAAFERVTQQLLELAPEVFVGCRTWGQFKDNQRAVVGLLPGDRDPRISSDRLKVGCS